MIASIVAFALTGGAVPMAPCAPPPSAAKGTAKDAPWFINGAEVSFNGRQFRKYGLPRELMPAEVRVAGVYKGVAVYLPSDTTLGDEVIYLPVDWSNCSFQPYALKT